MDSEQIWHSLECYDGSHRRSKKKFHRPNSKANQSSINFDLKLKLLWIHFKLQMIFSYHHKLCLQCTLNHEYLWKHIAVEIAIKIIGNYIFVQLKSNMQATCALNLNNFRLDTTFRSLNCLVCSCWASSLPSCNLKIDFNVISIVRRHKIKSHANVTEKKRFSDRCKFWSFFFLCKKVFN